MLGRNHIWLSCTSLLVLLSPWILVQPVTIALVVAGTWLGSLLPDVDSASSRVFKAGQITRAFGIVARWVLFLLVGILFRFILTPFDSRHRGSMHTLIGIGFYTAVITGVAYTACTVATYFTGVAYWNGAVWPVVVGLIFGGIMHLVEDSCTRRGIMPFIPLWGHWFHGGITTGNPRDKRPEIYGTVLAGEVAGIIVVQQFLHFPHEQVVSMAVAAFAMSWVIFYIISKIPIRAPRSE
jgi:inner membrane protein